MTKKKNVATRKNKRLFQWILAGCMLLAASAATLVLLYGNGRKPRYLVVPAVPEVTLVHCHLENDTAYFRIHCILENKSAFRLNIDSVYLNIFLGGELFVAEQQFIGLRQDRKERDSAILRAKIPHKALKKRIRALQGEKDTELAVDVALVYNTIAGKKTLSFNKHKRIEVPVPPELKILGVRKESLHLLKKELEATLFLEIQNPGKRLDIDISEFHYKLNIADELKTLGKLVHTVRIEPQKTTIVPFPGNFEIRTPFLTLAQILTDKDRLPFFLQIDGFVDSKKIHHLPVLITAKGMVELRNEDKVKEQKKRIRNL